MNSREREVSLHNDLLVCPEVQVRILSKREASSFRSTKEMKYKMFREPDEVYSVSR